MAGIIGQYNQLPRIRNVITNKIISPIGGSNPADLGSVSLPNVRGQVQFTIISGDNNFSSSFGITGGFGEFPTDWSQDWYPVTGSGINCDIKVLQKNRIEIKTPVSDAGGRIYIFEFKPVQSIGAKVRQNSVNIIGNNTLTIRMQKQIIIEGW